MFGNVRELSPKRSLSYYIGMSSSVKFLNDMLLNERKKRDSDPHISDQLKSLVPILGSSKEFLVALSDYQLAKLKADEQGMSSARIDGLAALLNSGVDIALCLSPFLPFRVLRVAAAAGYLSRVIGRLSPLDYTMSHDCARRLLDIPLVSVAMDRLFEFARSNLVRIAAA